MTFYVLPPEWGFGPLMKLHGCYREPLEDLWINHPTGSKKAEPVADLVFQTGFLFLGKVTTWPHNCGPRLSESIGA
jgi:hypothetical protein